MLLEDDANPPPQPALPISGPEALTPAEQAALPMAPFELEPLPSFPAALPPAPVPSNLLRTDADVELGPLTLSEAELILPTTDQGPAVTWPNASAASATGRTCPACGKTYGADHRDAFCVCGAELTIAPILPAAVTGQPLPVKPLPAPERPPPGTPCLVLYGPDKRPVNFFPLTKDVLLIGRLDPVSGCFPDVDVSEWVEEATARKVSRRHALILRSRATGIFTLRPLPGNTGTQVNAELLSAPEDVPLSTGTRVILGGVVRFKFEIT
jgi:hypothetical protein